MKLGTQTGSMTNHLMSNTKPVEPTVGMGATLLMWTDRQAYTIIEVKRNRFGLAVRVAGRRDKAIRTDGNGACENQDYRYEPDPNGELKAFSKRKDGRWRAVGESAGSVLSIGGRDEYHDYSFSEW